MNNRKRLVLLVFAAAIAAVGGVLAANLWLNPHQPTVETRVATVLPGGRSIAGFTLTDHAGQAFDNERLKGRWSFLFFGYTHCPDVCPNTLMTLADVAARVQQADGAAKPAQMVFVSVDPERDTPERLASYTTYFDPAFLGVTGDHEQLQKLTRDLGLLYVARRDDAQGDSYLVDHSAAVMLVNPAGRLQALFQAPHQPAAIAEDFLKIRSLYRE